MKKIIAKILCIVLTVATVVSVFSAAAFALPDFEDEYGAFLEKLGYQESRNDYTVVNSYGYLGRWQIGHMALKDIGFMIDSTHYSTLAASYGVYSDSDFLNNPAAQDYCVQALHKKIWGYILHYGDEKYIGKTMWDTKITISGMIAAGHHVGVGGLHEMLESGKAVSDANGYSAVNSLKNLGGFYVSKSLGITITVPATGVSLDRTSLSLGVGETAPLKAVFSPVDASQRAVSWSSDKTSVATVSSDGYVTAKGVGKAVITVKTSSGSYTAKCNVTVTAEKKSVIKSIVIAKMPSKTSYNVGDKFDKTGIKVNAEYDNGAVADVTSKCTLSGFSSTSAGQKKVTVSYTESGKTVTAAFTVTVKENSLEGTDSQSSLARFIKLLTIIKNKLLVWLKRF
ncbi:MAG: bacterial Ig-like domain-containing protein [Clostridia bacterium]|nr:bacterial Ig-like domain-containing protein [Clostridia bacterium]